MSRLVTKQKPIVSLFSHTLLLAFVAPDYKELTNNNQQVQPYLNPF